MAETQAVKAQEGAVITAETLHQEGIRWLPKFKVEKREGDWSDLQINAGEAPAPFEVIEGEGNLLTNIGAQRLWEGLIGTALTVFSNANARLGVGDSSTAEADTQTDLQAASNKLRKAMDATFPSISTDTITFRSTFTTSEANYVWAEWAVFNAASAGDMLNRKVAALGTKGSGATWTLTVTIQLT